jgi:uncharacterized surface protein with fasciclin (FAS1) repeats
LLAPYFISFGFDNKINQSRYFHLNKPPIPIMANILKTISNLREISIFINAIKSINLDRVIADSSMITVFVPNNSAFAQLSPVNSQSLTDDIGRLREIISAHLIPGRFEYRDLLKMSPTDNREVVVTAINGSLITINLSDGIRIGNSLVSSTDKSASNGIIHFVDRVIIPD